MIAEFQASRCYMRFGCLRRRSVTLPGLVVVVLGLNLMGGCFGGGDGPTPVINTNGCGSSSNPCSSPPPLVITSSSLPNGAIGQPYNATVQATGGSEYGNQGADYSWSVFQGTLPAGLTLSTVNNTGQISGTPSASGASTFTIQVTDMHPNSVGSTVKQLTITIQTNPNPVPSITTLSPGTVVAGSGTFDLTVSGSNFMPNPGGSTVAFGLDTGLVPSAVTSSSVTVSIPAKDIASPGIIPVTVANPPLGGGTSLSILSFIVTAPGTFAITTTSLPGGTAGQAYAPQQLQAAGGKTPYMWNVSNGQLPTGLTLTSAGVLTGTPTAWGSFAFSIRATDSSNPALTADQNFVLNIAEAAPLAVVTTSLPNGTVGRQYSFNLQASGGVPPYGWMDQLDVPPLSQPTLPAGLNLCGQPANQICGIPTSAGTYSVKLNLMDSENPWQAATGQWTLTINPAPPGTFHLVSANFNNPEQGANSGSSNDGGVDFTGRYVAFTSYATDLITPAPSLTPGIYLRDTCIGTNLLGGPICTGFSAPSSQLVDVNNNGQQASFGGGNPFDVVYSMSADGSVVGFSSGADNLDPRVTGGGYASYVRYLCQDTNLVGCPASTVLVSVDPAGNVVDGVRTIVSPDGRYVAFTNPYSGLGAGFVYLRDTCLGTPPTPPCVPSTVLVSIDTLGNQTFAEPQAVSVGGRYVLLALNLASLNTPTLAIRDLQLATTTTVSLDNSGNPLSLFDYGSMSDDGRYISFAATDSTNTTKPQIYVRDLCVGASGICNPKTILVSANTSGQPANSQSDVSWHALSRDGRYVAFSSLATDLITWSGTPPSGNFAYVRDTCTGSPSPCTPTTNLVGIDSLGNPVIVYTTVSLSGDGHYAVFTISDQNGKQQVVIANTGF